MPQSTLGDRGRTAYAPAWLRYAIAALGELYQLPFAQPDWLPDVIARCHLTPMTL